MPGEGKKPKVSKRGCRQKGSSFEREIVNYLREGDILAKRVPLSGATDFQKGDVVIHPRWAPDKPLVAECKRRAKLPTILEALGSHDMLFLREDRGEALVLMRLTLARDLLQ